MSPEQVLGKTVDHCTDILAFGTILYEMVTGKPPFRKSTSAETMTAILNEEPPSISQITPTAPPGMQRIVHRCLEKDPEQRFHSSHDLAFALEAMPDSTITTPSASHAQQGEGWRRRRITIVGTTVLVLIVASALAYLWLRPETVPRVSNYVQLTHDGQPKLLVGTDGPRLYLALGNYNSRSVGVIPISGGEPTKIPAASATMRPIDLSPDGSQILVEDQQKPQSSNPLWSLPVLGGPPRRLGDTEGQEAVWSSDGKMLAYSDGGDLFVAKADGTEPRKLVAMQSSAYINSISWWPDDTRLRFAVFDNAETPSFLWEVSADGTNLHRLFPGWHKPPESESCGVWTADARYFVFFANDQVWALPQKAGFFRSQPKPIQLTSTYSLSSLRPSKDGKKLFVSVTTSSRGELMRYDSKSGEFARFLGGISAEYPGFSKDGQWVAYVSYPEGTLWRSKIDGSERLQLTYPPNYAFSPRWSPDGKMIEFYASPPNGPSRIYEISPEGGTPRQLMPDDSNPQGDPNWSPDGSKIVFDHGFKNAASAILLLDLVTRKVTTLPGSQGLFLLNRADTTPIDWMWGGLGAYTSYNTLWLVAPWRQSLDIYTVRDDFSEVLGAHTLRFGGFLGWKGKNEVNGATSSTEYPQFASADWDTSTPTGNDLANVLAPGAQFGLSEQSTNLVVHIRWRDYELYAADNWKLRHNLTVDAGIRYSILAPPFQPNNQLTSFREELYNPNLPASDACNGLVTVPGYTPCTTANKLFGTNFTEAAAGQNRSLKDTNYHLFAPRLGISWDPTGSGNTAIRAGFGIFYQRDRTTPYYVNSANAPFVLNAFVTRTLEAPPATTIPPSGTSPSGGYDPSNTVANSLQWNLTTEHAFGRSTTLEVGYVGNHAIHQLNSYQLNWVPQAEWLDAAFAPGGNTNPFRRYPGWGSMAWWSNNGDSNYNSLQVLFKAQLQKFQLQAAYTWSHSIGNVTNQDWGGLGQQSFIYGPNPALDRGNTEINRPQTFVANAIYYLPELKHSNAFLRNTVGGWELAGITQYSSGASTTLFTSTITDLAGPGFDSLSGTGSSDRPLVTGVPCTGIGGPQIFNPAALTLVSYAIGTIPPGTEPRGYCRGPSYVNTDFSIDKNWRLWREKLRLQFRLDFFNLFNHPNFRADMNTGFNAGVNCGAPDAVGAYMPCSPTNNIITHQVIQEPTGFTTLTKGPRELQYGLKVMF